MILKTLKEYPFLEVTVIFLTTIRNTDKTKHQEIQHLEFVNLMNLNIKICDVSLEIRFELQ